MKFLLAFAFLLTTSAAAETSSADLAEALRMGFAAEASADADDLMKAAVRLRQLGGQPAEGETDLAELWGKMAKAMGAKVPLEPDLRGRVLGPAYRVGELPAGGRFSTRQSFIAGLRADVAVEPVGSVQLELGVNDGEGKPVCRVHASRKILGCRWVPTVTEVNEIIIINSDTRPVKFYLILN
jgi:hypothetical protein